MKQKNSVAARRLVAASCGVAAALSLAGVAYAQGPMTWQYGYDAQGNRRTEIDPLGSQTIRGYDPLDRPSQISRPPSSGSNLPTSVTLDHDAQGNLVRVTDPRHLPTQYTFDGLRNLAALVSPDTGTSVSTHDAAGNLVSRTDSRGQTTTFHYDALDRLTQATYASGSPSVFEYDGGSRPAPYSVGRLTRIVDESGETAYAYDAFGHVVEKSQTVGGKTLNLAYAWGSPASAGAKLIAVTYPSGTRVDYGHDSAGRVNTVTVRTTNGNTLQVLANLAYNAANQAQSWVWGNGTSYRRTFDGFGRLSGYPLGAEAGAGAAAGLWRALAYDDAGRIVGYTHSRGGQAQPAFDQSFAYDALGQLQVAKQAQASHAYGYDASGNRTAKTVGGTSHANTIDPTSNRMLQAQWPVARNFGYDNAGNTLADGLATYVYSSRGRLATATTAQGTVGYRYNGLEQRVIKTGPGNLVPTGAAYYAFDESGQLLGEYDANLQPLYETIYLGATPVAVVQQGAVYNVYADHLDTPRVITRSSDQAIVWRWDTAEAFGAAPADQNPGGFGTFVFNQRFPGQVFDAETGNHYNWHRDYAPGIGGYAQSDPSGLVGGINTYQYVGGNPLGFTDPRGLAIGDYPPPPPGYGPKWDPGQFSNNGRWFLTDPDGARWIAHQEDFGHWRHWDKEDDDGNDQGRWPPNSKKMWPLQKKPKMDQCVADPNGDAPPWLPPNSDFTIVPPPLPWFLNPRMSPMPRVASPIRVPVFP